MIHIRTLGTFMHRGIESEIVKLEIGAPCRSVGKIQVCALSFHAVRHAEHSFFMSLEEGYTTYPSLELASPSSEYRVAGESIVDLALNSI